MMKRAASQSEPLREYMANLVDTALAAGLDQSALFLAERLFAALSQDEVATYLLAAALLRCHNPQACIYILRSLVRPPTTGQDAVTYQGSAQQQVLKKPATRSLAHFKSQQSQLVPAHQSSLRCAWLYAQASNAVNRPRQGEQALAAAMAKFPNAAKSHNLGFPSASTPSQAALNLHLARLALKSNRVDQAAAYYENALKDCWWCYEAFEALCNIGRAPSAQRYFGGSLTLASSSARKPLSAGPSQPIRHSSIGAPASPQLSGNLSISIDSSSASESSFFNPRPPTTASGSSSSSSAGLYTPTQAFPSSHLNAPPPNRRQLALSKDAVRRSTRLTGPTSQNLTPVMMSTSSEKSSKNKEPRSRLTSNPRERKRAKGSMSPPASASLPGISTNAAEALPSDPQSWLKSVLTRFGTAESCLSVYDAQGALDALLGLDVEQRRSWRACIGVGRARMESLDYAAAEKAFSAARETAPYMLAYGDLHSTLLWHLSRSTDLSYLAQQLMSLDPLAHQSWVASGNVFSLLDDHKNALKCFKRAIQLVEGPRLSTAQAELGMTVQVDGTGEYAYVLAGHECVALEEWESALGFYREALRRKHRSYTAWFGMGNVYMKTGQLRLAEYHFTKASEINPTNAMLLSCVGTVAERLGKRAEALHLYERAAALAPTSAAVCFKKCKLLVSMRRYQTALKDLLSLAALASDEWNVQFLLGKVYGALGQQAQMTKHFTFAQDLDPRSAHKIREAMERINEKRQERVKAMEEDDELGSPEM